MLKKVKEELKTNVDLKGLGVALAIISAGLLGSYALANKPKKSKSAN